MILHNASQHFVFINTTSSLDDYWKGRQTSNLLDYHVHQVEVEKRPLPAVTIMVTLNILLFSYLVLIILAPRPKCTCKARLTGKTVVITGGSDGVGKVTAIELAKRGAQIILPCRNLEKGYRVAKEIYRRTGNKNILILFLDFENLSSVKTCAEEIQKRVTKIDILINNAGIGHGVGLTCDGLPKIFGTNHIGPFLLTRELLFLLRKSCSSRIIFVSSIAHLWGKIDFDELVKPDGGLVHSQFRAYARSKLANVLLAKQLAKEEEDYGIKTYVAHPGWTFTAMFRDFPRFLKLIVFPIFHLFLYLPEEGAQTQIHLALAENLGDQSGDYFVSCRPSKTCASALDAQLGKDLWNFCDASVNAVLNKDILTCTSI